MPRIKSVIRKCGIDSLAFSKMKNYCTVAVVLLTLSQSLHLIAAEGSGSEEGSPQYMYMERLRKLTRTSSADKTGIATEDAQTPGTLLASSFKDTCKYNFCML